MLQWMSLQLSYSLNAQMQNSQNMCRHYPPDDTTWTVVQTAPVSGFQVFVTSHLLHRSTHPYDGPALIFMRGICQPSHTPLIGYAPIMLCQSTSKPNIFPVIT
jgi:hypothetical protein